MYDLLSTTALRTLTSLDPSIIYKASHGRPFHQSVLQYQRKIRYICPDFTVILVYKSLSSKNIHTILSFTIFMRLTESFHYIMKVNISEVC